MSILRTASLLWRLWGRGDERGTNKTSPKKKRRKQKRGKKR